MTAIQILATAGASLTVAAALHTLICPGRSINVSKYYLAGMYVALALFNVGWAFQR
jgi:hypothetical protein